VRLQDISLAYNVDKRLLDKIGAANLKLFVSGKNLFTLTNWDGWDPETGQGIQATNSFPVMKAYAFGLELSF
jgi:TonB-dependent starch-binding outer membrane protein SusC